MFKALYRSFSLLCCFGMSIPMAAGPIDQTVHAVRKGTLRPIVGGVRILLDGGCSEIPLGIEGSYGIYDTQSKERLTGGLVSKNLPLVAGKEGISWGESFPDTHQITLIPEGDRRGFRLKEQYYPGILHVYQIDGVLRLVNEVTPEEFALAIVNSETDKAHAPIEAASSLAICARTFAVDLARQREQQFWHFEAPRCGYLGYANLKNLDACSRAQAKSLGLILISRKNRPFITEWTKDCAGHTIDYDRMHVADVHFPRGGTKGVTSKWATQNREQARWTVDFSRAEFAQIFHLDESFDLHLERDPASQKVQMISIDDRGSKKGVDFYRFQRLCSGRIASSEFSIDREKDRLVFSGFGKGPGVGLCLFSAGAMANEGKLAHEILEHFFPGSELVLSSTVD